MYAIQQHEVGPPETLRYEPSPDPQPTAGQVRIAVQASGVHFVDTAIRAGSAPELFPTPSLPTIPGREVAGVVDELGDDVERSWLGTRVVTHLGAAGRGYAELAVADIGSVHVLPDAVSFPQAVAMIGTGRTTMGILDHARIAGDDVLLVTAAAGGIGNLIVQYGRSVGATVVGVAGGEAKVEHVRRLGATIAVDYNEPDWPAAVRTALGEREVSVVLEGVGGDLGRDAMELLGPGGRLVMFGWSSKFGTPTKVTTEDLVGRGLTAGWAIGPAMLRRSSPRELEERALAAVATGELVPTVQTFPLHDAAAAHRALETRGTVGKVVLVP